MSFNREKIVSLKFINLSSMTLYIATYLDSLSPCPPSYDVLALLDLAFNVNADLQKYFQKMTTRSYSCWLLLFLFLSRIKIIAKLFWLKILCWEHKSIVFICFKITLTWGIPENVHSYSCWVLLFQSLTWSQNDCKTILFKELILGMEKNKSI